jgi:glucuronokinase
LIEPLQPNLVLSVERDELGINAGLQDRVIQTYTGLMYMDFGRELMSSRGYGDYVRLDLSKV